MLIFVPTSYTHNKAICVTFIFYIESFGFETKYFLTYPDLECELIEERRIDIAKQYYTKEEP